MREIKFRAWMKEEQKMYYPPEESNNDIAFSMWENSEDSEWILMQFTNLLDKNGKEIYEGSCFERNGHKGVVEQADSGLWIVTFDDEKVIALLSDSEWGWRCNEQEVIGNIHESSSTTSE